MLYKYKPADNFEQVVDIIENNRLYFPQVNELNDPMEGINNLCFAACGNSYHLTEGSVDQLWRTLCQ